MTLMIARGDMPAFRDVPPLPSPLDGVSDGAWTVFVRTCATQSLNAVTPSNGYGYFELKPRRLADIGLMENLRSLQRRIDGNDHRVWEGDFAPPLTAESFLANPLFQFNAFATSIEQYDKVLDSEPSPPDISRSGKLAILHRAGPNGLRSWTKHQFPGTVELVRRANGIF